MAGDFDAATSEYVLQQAKQIQSLKNKLTATQEQRDIFRSELEQTKLDYMMQGTALKGAEAKARELEEARDDLTRQLMRANRRLDKAQPTAASEPVVASAEGDSGL